MSHHHNFCRPNDHQLHRGKFAVIRNPSSGLVLDASQFQVKLAHFTGFPAQLWSVEVIGGGKFLLINKQNRKALDIEGGQNSGAHLITYEKHGRDNQQWRLNDDHTIVSSGGLLAIDINKNQIAAGTSLIAYPRHGRENQQFYFQYQ